ncbi:MAG: DUF4340 domain-containing protein [Kiritimatiellae bacterium]|nr:DUF4340 domain-containing protein [Kiritimatiellia bacterium]
MSNRRAILVLLVAVAALAAANLALDRRGGIAVAGGRTTLIDPSWEVSRIRIARKSSPPTVLVKAPDWRLAEPYAASVDEPVVLRLLDALSLRRVVDGISDSKLLGLGRTRADFALEDPVVRITVSGSFGEASVSIGAPTPEAEGVYASVDGEESVLIVPSGVLSAVDVPADSFRRRSLFLIGPESVSSFDIKRGSGSMLSFVRRSESWRIGDADAASPKVQKFLADLTSSSVVEFIWPKGATNEEDRVSASLLAGYGLDPDNAIAVTLKGSDGMGRQVLLGKSAGEGRVFALVQNGSAVATVPSSLRDAAAQDAVMFTDSRLFPLEPQGVAYFSVTDGDTAYALARGDGGTWRIESPIVAQADAAVAEAMLSRILALSSSDVDAGGLGVSLSTNAAPVRVARRSVLDGGFESLRSREMLKIDPKAVRRIVRTPGVGGGRPSAVVYGRDRQAWNVESGGGASGAVSEAGVQSVLESLNPLEAVRVVRLKVAASDLGAYGLDAPFLTIAIDQERADAVRRNILIGGETEGGRFATIGSADAVFVLSDASVSAMSAPLVSD